MILKQYKPEYVIYVSLLAGALILALTFSKISAIIQLLNSLAGKVSIHQEFITLLVKITGIAILTEFAVSICKDSGETAIASKIDMGRKSYYGFNVNTYYSWATRNNAKDFTIKILKMR